MSVRAWAGFFAMSTIWGVPYLFIKVAVDDGVPPAFLAWSRVVLAAAVLLALARRAGTLGSLRGRWRWLVAFAVFEIAVPFPLIASGEQTIDSSVAAIIIAAAPLIVALLALRFDESERVSGRRLVGLLIGLGGVVALGGIDIAGGTDEPLRARAILLARPGVPPRPRSSSRPRATPPGRWCSTASSPTPIRARRWVRVLRSRPSCSRRLRPRGRPRPCRRARGSRRSSCSGSSAPRRRS